jgi:glycosyltransferase involved in cell wall biosynthesis
MTKVALITNIPSPYRVLQFDLLNEELNNNLIIIYLKKTESNRKWNIPNLNHNYIFLKESFWSKFNLYPNIIPALSKATPDTIIATGFTPTILITFIYAKVKNKKFIVFTDSWIHSVNKLSLLHKYIRKFIIPKADASICVGQKGRDYLESYGAKPKSIFISPLSINNDYYQKFYKPLEEREYDIIFSGQFIEIKMPFFLIDILKELKLKNGTIKLLIIGSGPLEKKIMSKLEENNIEYYFPGFIQQENLPKFYSNAKILLFPTRKDPWGLVSNEACAVGTPVITCKNAGAADDLIIHGYNGFVLPLSTGVWVKHINKLLTDNDLLEKFSQNALSHIRHYSVTNAVKGIKDAINYDCNNLNE